MTTQIEPRVLAPREQDLVLSGGFGRSSNSARAGFLPIGLEHLPLRALEGIGVYIRVKPEPGNEDLHHASCFRLYCAAEIRFADLHRRRLQESGVRFIYIRMADQSRFRQQTESALKELSADTAMGVCERSSIIYDTSMELMNELLAEPELMARSPRLEQVSRSIATLVMNNASAFSHLFAASHHDFYTATHLVNVGTWMVPLAYELGYRDPEELSRICQAGFLHDMGKIEIPEEVLNKPGKLSPEDWAAIKRHPDAGVEYLSKFGGVHPLVLAVTREHHERMDGTGYPRGLKGDQVDRLSRICAVVDSFDAMTAFRPFKDRTLSVDEALAIIQKETPAKYDPEVVTAWMKLMKRAEQEAGGVGVAGIGAPAAEPLAQDKRRDQRKSFHCPARAHVLEAKGLSEQPAIPVVAHSISRSGLGFLCPRPVPPGEFVRVYMSAKGWEGRALEGQTVRCRDYNDTWHEVGMMFSRLDEVAGGAE